MENELELLSYSVVLLIRQHSERLTPQFWKTFLYSTSKRFFNSSKNFFILMPNRYSWYDPEFIITLKYYYLFSIYFMASMSHMMLENRFVPTTI